MQSRRKVDEIVWTLLAAAFIWAVIAAAVYGFASPAPTSDDTRTERKAAYENAGSGAEPGLEVGP